MSNRFLSLFFLGQLLTVSANCQGSAKSIDSILSDSYRQFLSSRHNQRHDRLSPTFKSTLVRFLSSPVIFHNTLDSLETLITIRQSADKKLKFYSWDELTGGSWHEINSIVQFKGSRDKILYQQLDTDREMEEGGYSDSEIYEVHVIEEGNSVYYLTFGWGTHGSGAQHKIVYLFRIDGDSLIKCSSFYNGERQLTFEYSRSDTLNLEFDSETKVLSFDEFAENGEELFARKTGRRETLKFVEGVFH